jgi:DNA-binding NarL/FixJ family response regulator
MDEPYDDFMVRIREMSSAKYRPLGFENPRASSSAKMTGTKVNAARRAAKSEVVALFGRGKSDEEIAESLGLSVGEVQSLRVMKIGRG